MIIEAKKYPRITVGEKLHLRVIKSPKLPLDITSMPVNYLEGMPEKKAFPVISPQS